MRYYARVGDLLHNPESGAFAIVTKLTSTYIYFSLMSRDNETLQFVHSAEKVKKNEVYYHLDKGEINIYYGSAIRRRTRPKVEEYIY